MSWSFLGSQTIAATTAGSTLALTLPSSGVTQMVEFQPAGGPAYVTFDGSAPSSVAGMVLSTGNGPYKYSHNALANTKIVFDTTDCFLTVLYFG